MVGDRLIPRVDVEVRRCWSGKTRGERRDEATEQRLGACEVDGDGGHLTVGTEHRELEGAAAPGRHHEHVARVEQTRRVGGKEEPVGGRRRRGAREPTGDINDEMAATHAEDVEGGRA